MTLHGSSGPLIEMNCNQAKTPKIDILICAEPWRTYWHRSR
jgi:hypothetical protein